MVLLGALLLLYLNLPVTTPTVTTFALPRVVEAEGFVVKDTRVIVGS